MPVYVKGNTTSKTFIPFLSMVDLAAMHHWFHFSCAKELEKRLRIFYWDQAAIWTFLWVILNPSTFRGRTIRRRS